MQWIGRFEIAMRRVRTAWNDLADVTAIPDLRTQEFMKKFLNILPRMIPF